MNDNNAREMLKDEMLEQGLVAHEGGLLTYFFNGREYLVMLSVVDITNWQTETDKKED